MAEDSANKWEYEAKIAKRFGFEQQLELPIPPPHLSRWMNMGQSRRECSDAAD